jgi:hypothetical protein
MSKTEQKTGGTPIARTSGFVILILGLLAAGCVAVLYGFKETNQESLISQVNVWVKYRYFANGTKVLNWPVEWRIESSDVGFIQTGIWVLDPGHKDTGLLWWVKVGEMDIYETRRNRTLFGLTLTSDLIGYLLSTQVNMTEFHDSNRKTFHSLGEAICGFDFDSRYIIDKITGRNEIHFWRGTLILPDSNRIDVGMNATIRFKVIWIGPLGFRSFTAPPIWLNPFHLPQGSK